MPRKISAFLQTKTPALLSATNTWKGKELGRINFHVAAGESLVKTPLNGFPLYSQFWVSSVHCTHTLTSNWELALVTRAKPFLNRNHTHSAASSQQTEKLGTVSEMEPLQGERSIFYAPFVQGSELAHSVPTTQCHPRYNKHPVLFTPCLNPPSSLCPTLQSKKLHVG